jgi:hypothetical protein
MDEHGMNEALPNIVQLHELKSFLEKVGNSNEDTTFSQEQEPLVQLLINLCTHLEKTSIVEDFEQAFVHPMITVQKWNTELEQIVVDEIDKSVPES